LQISRGILLRYLIYDWHSDTFGTRRGSRPDRGRRTRLSQTALRWREIHSLSVLL